MLIDVDNHRLPKLYYMAGYSSTPLIRKLGINDHMKIMIISPPEDFMNLLEKDITKQLTNDTSTANFIHLFVTSKAELEKRLLSITKNAKNDSVVWSSWYKKSSKIATDVTEDVIREMVLPTGWVDVKVCAVSDTWSGLKIVKRKINK